VGPRCLVTSSSCGILGRAGKGLEDFVLWLFLSSSLPLPLPLPLPPPVWGMTEGGGADVVLLAVSLLLPLRGTTSEEDGSGVAFLVAFLSLSLRVMMEGCESGNEMDAKFCDYICHNNRWPPVARWWTVAQAATLMERVHQDCTIIRDNRSFMYIVDIDCRRLYLRATGALYSR
jgi:hypothetical protein